MLVDLTAQCLVERDREQFGIPVGVAEAVTGDRVAVSNRRTDVEKGSLSDPIPEAAANDAADLADRIARGASRPLRVGLYLCEYAPTLAELDEAVAHVRAAAASVLLDTQPTTWRQVQG